MANRKNEGRLDLNKVTADNEALSKVARGEKTGDATVDNLAAMLWEIEGGR